MSGKITHIDNFEKITNNIQKVKTDLEEVFTINMKEEAERYVAMMEKYNTETNKSALSNCQDKLLRILKAVPSYAEKHYTTDYRGRKVAVGLLDNFNSLEENAIAIEEYKKYVSELRSIEELDDVFMDRISTLHKHYRSSSDYMTRTVVRLLNDYNSKIANRSEKYDLSEPTRLLILKHFIRQFGYLEELAEKDKFQNGKLREYIEKNYNKDFLLMDDSVFGLIECPDKYIGALTKLHGTIKYKAPTILMDKQLIKEVCSVMEESVLSDKAKNGTAVFLSDCFVKPSYEIDMFCFKDCYNVSNTEKYVKLNDLLKKRCQVGRLHYTDFTYPERLYSLIKSYSDSIVLGKETGKTFCHLFGYAFNGYPKPKEISKIFNKEVLSDRDVINRLPNDIIDELGIPIKTRFITMMTKLSRDIICSQELCDKINSFPGLDEILSPLPNYKISVESQLNKELLKKHNISEETSMKLTYMLEKELLGKETLHPEDYLDLLINHYGKHIKIQALKPEYVNLFSDYLIFNKKNKSKKRSADELTVADVFDVKKINFTECENDCIKETVDLLESSLIVVKHDKKEEREEKVSKYISSITNCIGRKNNIKYVEKITKDQYSNIIRIITVLSNFSTFIPAEKQIFTALTNAIPTIPFKKSKSPKTLFDIVEEHMGKIKSLREYDIVGKNEEALSTFLELTEIYIENKYYENPKTKKPVSYENALRDLLFIRYNEAIKTNGFLYKENKKNILSNPKSENPKSSSEKSDDSGYEFLYMADKLAKAEFSGQGESSRELLYIFATAFEMLYGYDNGNLDDYELRDLEKNLFLDYYCDNFVNDPEAALDDKKKLVSGKGINYKNFAEIAFLWALASKEIKYAKDKLLAAYEIIFYCRKNGKPVSEFKKPQKGIKDNGTLTYLYQKDFYDKIINESSKENVKKYLIKNFPCVNDNNYFGINAQSRTAKQVIDEHCETVNALIETIAKENGWIYSDLKEFFESCCNFDFTCYRKEEQNLLEIITKRLNIIKSNRLTYNQVCRTTLLVSCYYHMRLINLVLRRDGEKVPYISFSNYYKIFCRGHHNTFTSDQGKITINYDGADNLLTEAGYQSVNPKNIFDTYLIFLAYRDAIKCNFY